MQSLNGRRVLQNVSFIIAASSVPLLILSQEIKVNWAYQSNNTSKEDTSQHFHIFVGDLSNEVNDEVLLQAFGNYGNVSEARVMWDMKTGRSRGYGFVAFRDRMEADKALNGMNGEFLGSRAIRCNWANQKGQPSMVQSQALTQMGMAPVMATTAPMPQSFAPPSLQAYQTVHAQSPPDMTTIWVGNITPYTTQNDLLPFFSAFGQIQEMRFHSDKGFAFVKMDTHENATNAICTLNGHAINGKPMRVNVCKSTLMLHSNTNLETVGYCKGPRSKSCSSCNCSTSSIHSFLSAVSRTGIRSIAGILPAICSTAWCHATAT
jgi:RNA recognition motif-containing protein